MKKTYLFLLTVVAFAAWPACSEAQYIVDYKRQGDQYFALQDYYAAGVFYQRALRLLPDTTGKTYIYPYAFNGNFGKRQEKNAEQYQYLVYQLGEAFRHYKDFKSAEQWYDKVVQFKNDRFPLARLWYAVCLRADGRYEEAKEQLQQFQAAYTEQDEYRHRAELELQSCEYALDQLKYPRLADIRKLPSPVNDSGSNYAPVVVGQDFYFTSSRPLPGVDASKENPYVNKIYKANISGGDRFDSLKQLSVGSGLRTELASGSFSPARTRMYVTTWEQPKNKKKGETPHYSIAISKKDDQGGWSAPVALGAEVNAAGYDSKEPFMVSNGQGLLFSSNRPGGQGGYDLWYCPLTMDGLPSGEAVNLGAAINTPGDEVNPYYQTNDHTLIFSSDGRVGMGGFDLYRSTGSLGAGSWTPPENLGYPVNSAKDDNFYFPEGEAERFYTSSDRSSVCCLEIYDVQLKHIGIAGTLYDCDTHGPLAGATVELRDSLAGSVIGTQTTDERGSYRFQVVNQKPLQLSFAKDKYFGKKMQVTTEALQAADTLFSREICLKAFEVGKPIVIPNILYDFNKATLRPESKLVLDSLANILNDNPRLMVRMSANTDSIGSDEYNLKLSQRRAQACVDYLTSIGIPADRMEAKGNGESMPIAPNSKPDGSDNPEGRQLNRRTEFTVIKD